MDAPHDSGGNALSQAVGIVVALGSVVVRLGVALGRLGWRRAEERLLPHRKPAQPKNPPLTRRQFLLASMSIGIGGLAGTVIAAPVVGFVFSPLIQKPQRVWRSVGKISQFKIGETSLVTFENASPLPWAGLTARSAAYVRRDSSTHFAALSINCQHLDCPVRWDAQAQLFLCPCHGGVYYADGHVAAGPPPRPLPSYPVRLRNGAVEILTSPIPFA